VKAKGLTEENLATLKREGEKKATRKREKRRDIIES